MRSLSLVSRFACTLVAAFALALASSGRAAAQPDGTAQGSAAPAAGSAAPAAGSAAPAADSPAPVAPTPPTSAEPPPPPPTSGPPVNAGTASYHSPMRGTCEDELKKDTDWFSNLKDRLGGSLAADFARYAEARAKYEAAVSAGTQNAPAPTAPAWYGNLVDGIYLHTHTEAAHAAVQNNKHVVYAYSVFWVLTAGFVLLMWRRQRTLSAEVARLERELARAIKEGGGA